MKRILSFAVLGALGVMLGCPLYGGDGGSTTTCNSNAECPSGSTCVDGACEVGDCTVTGCSTGSTCKLQNGTASCVANSDGGGGDSGPGPYSGCFADTECSSLGSGAKCLNAQCTSAVDECADETQCGANEKCAQGVCTASCSASVACPTGYGCDTTNGICSQNPTACTVPGGACGSNGICVEGHCDAKCGTGNTCATGLVCVNGGCMPNERASFICTTEGVQDVCASGSICLRHNCYISCAGNVDACKTADEFNVCKSVTLTSGTYQVCGSSTNLGSDCDPTIGKNCPASGVCIDGYCH